MALHYIDLVLSFSFLFFFFSLVCDGPFLFLHFRLRSFSVRLLLLLFSVTLFFPSVVLLCVSTFSYHLLVYFSSPLFFGTTIHDPSKFNV